MTDDTLWQGTETKCVKKVSISFLTLQHCSGATHVIHYVRLCDDMYPPAPHDLSDNVIFLVHHPKHLHIINYVNSLTYKVYYSWLMSKKIDFINGTSKVQLLYSIIENIHKCILVPHKTQTVINV